MAKYNPYFVCTRRSLPQARISFSWAPFLISGIVFILHLNLLEVMRADRWQHFLISAGLVLFFNKILRNQLGAIVYALVIGFCIGFAKELMDPHFEVFDIYANLFGLAVGFLIFVVSPLFLSRPGPLFSVR